VLLNGSADDTRTETYSNCNTDTSTAVWHWLHDACGTVVCAHVNCPMLLVGWTVVVPDSKHTLTSNLGPPIASTPATSASTTPTSYLYSLKCYRKSILPA